MKSCFILYVIYICELGPKERKIYFRENWLKVLGIWGAAELIWGFGEHKQNTFRELRQKLSGIWGDQSIIFRELGSKDPPWGGHNKFKHKLSD